MSLRLKIYWILMAVLWSAAIALWVLRISAPHLFAQLARAVFHL